MTANITHYTPEQIQALPESSARGGCIYIVRFATGDAKLGRTQRPKQRITTLTREAEAHGRSVTGVWLSIAHRDYAANERKMLALGGEFSTGKRGREYFASVDVLALLEAVSTFDYSPVTADEVAQSKQRMQALTDAVLGSAKPRTPTSVAERAHQVIYDLAVELGIETDFTEPETAADLEAQQIMFDKYGVTDRAGYIAAFLGNVVRIVELQARHPHLKEEARA